MTTFSLLTIVWRVKQGKSLETVSENEVKVEKQFQQCEEMRREINKRRKRIMNSHGE